MPSTATRSPAFADELRSALNVVRPAHSNGAAATELRSSGTDIRPLAFGSSLRHSRHHVARRCRPGSGSSRDRRSGKARNGRSCRQGSRLRPAGPMPIFNAVAQRIDPTDCLVARNTRPLDRKHTFNGRCVRMAHSAGLHADTNMAWWGIGEWLFCQLESAWTYRVNCTICRCG